jgi:hypothetical protein
MRAIIAAGLLLACASAWAGEPPSHPTQTEKPFDVAIAPPPPVAFQVRCPKGDTECKPSPAAPQTVILIVCRIDDLTGLPGRHDPAMAARNWRDLEPHIVNAEIDCKRQRIDLEDAAVLNNPRKPSVHADATATPLDKIIQEKMAPATKGPLYVEPLAHNFGNPGECVRAAAFFIPSYHEKGWGVLKVGCPTPIVDPTGKIVGWHLPGCPKRIGGMEGIRCKFDESLI